MEVIIMTTLRNYAVNYLISRIKDADLDGIKSKSELAKVLCGMPMCTEEEADEFAQQYFSEILDFISQFNLPDFNSDNIMLRNYILRYYSKIIIYSLDLPADLSNFSKKYLKNLLDILLVG